MENENLLWNSNKNYTIVVLSCHNRSFEEFNLNIWYIWTFRFTANTIAKLNGDWPYKMVMFKRIYVNEMSLNWSQFEFFYFFLDWPWIGWFFRNFQKLLFWNCQHMAVSGIFTTKLFKNFHFVGPILNSLNTLCHLEKRCTCYKILCTPLILIDGKTFDQEKGKDYMSLAPVL